MYSIATSKSLNCKEIVTIEPIYIIATAAITMTMRPNPLETNRRPAPEDDPPELPVADGTALVGKAVASAPTPPSTGPVAETVGSEPPIAIAADWNALKVLVPFVGALIDPTMPMPQ